MVLLGESVLATKCLEWDSEKLPFKPENWDEYGFKVFSQNNEDGLIQYLIRHTEIPQKTFIEFGVESYHESNTRFLCLRNNWSGLIMDGSLEYMNAVRKENIYWLRTLESKGVFITKENINELISESGFSGNIGILSVDIDGVDYWVLNEIKCIKPQILICEYNPIFGAKSKVSVPYKKDFYRTNEHYSNLYWGASLGAYNYFAQNNGYKLVCINNVGTNAFFVKKEASSLPEISVEDAFREYKCRESRDPDGNLSFLSAKQGKELIKDLPVIDVVTNKTLKISELE